VSPYGDRPGSKDSRPGSKDSKAVYQISDAQPGLSEDISARTRRYVISMGIRTVCFPIAVFTEGWVRWMFVAAALVLPYFAVIIANAGRERVDAMAPAPGLGTRLALPPGVAPVRMPDDVDGFLRAAGQSPPPDDHPGPDHPGSTGWERRSSA
jgi:hypothetical protein